MGIAVAVPGAWAPKLVQVDFSLRVAVLTASFHELHCLLGDWI